VESWALDITMRVVSITLFQRFRGSCTHVNKTSSSYAYANVAELWQCVVDHGTCRLLTGGIAHNIRTAFSKAENFKKYSGWVWGKQNIVLVWLHQCMRQR